MAKRTIKTALGTYRDAKTGNVGAFGFRGQEVDVHDDDLERFDSLNRQPGVDPDEDEPDFVDNTVQVGPNRMVSPAAGDETSGVGSGLNDALDVDDDGVADGDDSTAEEDAKEAEDTDAPRRPRRAAKRAGARKR
jgi:hypothetical protein